MHLNKSLSIIHQHCIHTHIHSITQYNSMQLHLSKSLSQYFTNIPSMITNPFLIVTTSTYTIISGKYIDHISNIYQKYTKIMDQHFIIIPYYKQKLYFSYTKNISKVYQKYTKNIARVYQKYKYISSFANIIIWQPILILTIYNKVEIHFPSYSLIYSFIQFH